MNFVAVVIVFSIVPGHSFNKESEHLIGSDRIRICFGNSSQITKSCTGIK